LLGYKHGFSATDLPMNRPFRAGAFAVLALATGAAQAQSSATEPLWEVGAVAFGVSQQAYPGSDHQVRRGIVLPWLLYRGRFLRADGETIGVRPVKTPTFEVDIGVAGAFGSNASDIEARRGMPNLGTLVEFGPRVKWNLGGSRETGLWRLDLPLRGVFDLSDSLAHRGFVFQPTLSWRRASGGWSYSVSGSALVGDERLASTFYEVAPRFATASRPAYDAQAGLIGWRLGTFATRDLTRDWRVFGFARIDSVAGAANRGSPLVRQTTGASVGIGVSYTFMRSQQPAVD